jgi:hypothetical protein
VLVGIGLAIVMLAGLSIYQTTRAGRLKEAKAQAVREATSGAADAAPGTTPYFIACFRGNNARYFRVYTDDGGLLFLYAGPYFAMIDPDTPRGTDERHWLLRSVRLVAITLAAGAVGAVIAVALILIALAPGGRANPAAATSVMLGMAALLGFLALGAMRLGPWTMWWMTRRGEELDAMSRRELREHAETHELSFGATRDSVSEVKITLLEPDEVWLAKNEIGVKLDFQHAPTGRWKIQTLTTRDTCDAVQVFSTLLDADQIHTDPGIKYGLPKAMHAVA